MTYRPRNFYPLFEDYYFHECHERLLMNDTLGKTSFGRRWHRGAFFPLSRVFARQCVGVWEWMLVYIMRLSRRK